MGKLRYMPTKPFGNQTQATERRALDSTANVDSTVVYCMSRVVVPGTHIWRWRKLRDYVSKALGNQTQATDGRWTARRTQTSLSHLVQLIAFRGKQPIWGSGQNVHCYGNINSRGKTGAGSAAHVDSTVVYCMSRVDVPGTHNWRTAQVRYYASKA